MDDGSRWDGIIVDRFLQLLAVADLYLQCVDSNTCQTLANIFTANIFTASVSRLLQRITPIIT